MKAVDRRTHTPQPPRRRFERKCPRPGQAGGKCAIDTRLDAFREYIKDRGLPWKHNACRASAGSYFFAKTNYDEDETLGLMGHLRDPDTFFAHYRSLVDPAQGEAYYNLLPAGMPKSPPAGTNTPAEEAATTPAAG